MLSHHANARPSRNELAGIGNAVGQLVIEKCGFARVRFPIPEIRSSLRGAVMAVWPLDCGRAFAFRGCLLVMSGKSSVSGNPKLIVIDSSVAGRNSSESRRRQG